MIARFFAFLILIWVLYLLSVFLLPDISDRIFGSGLGDKIRTFKSSLESYSGSSESLYERLKKSTSDFVTETKDTTEHIQKTLETKIDQTEQAVESAKDAYTAVEKAKNDFQNLTTFSSGSTTESSR